MPPALPRPTTCSAGCTGRRWTKAPRWTARSAPWPAIPPIRRRTMNGRCSWPGATAVPPSRQPAPPSRLRSDRRLPGRGERLLGSPAPRPELGAGLALARPGPHLPGDLAPGNRPGPDAVLGRGRVGPEALDRAAPDALVGLAL